MGGGGMLKVLGIIVGLLGAIYLVTNIIGAFFEAVGPFLKILIKVLVAFFLILFAPILKALAPHMKEIITAFLGLGKVIGGQIQKLIDAIGTGDIFKILIEMTPLVGGILGILLVGKAISLTVDLVAGALGGILGKFFNVMGEVIFKPAIDITLNLAKNAIAKLTALFTTTMLYGVPLGGLFAGTALLGIGIALLIVTTGDPLAQAVSAALVGTGLILTASALAGLGITLPEGIAFGLVVGIVFAIMGGLENIIPGLKQQLDKARTSLGAAPGQSVLQSWITDPLKAAGDAMNAWLYNFLLNMVPQMKNKAATTPAGTDFISRPGVGMIPFSSSDTIIGAKDFSKLGGGVTVNNTFNIDAGVDASKLKDILTKFSREQARELRMRTSYTAGTYA